MEPETRPSLDALISRHGGRLAGLLAGILGHPEDVRDVCQETWCAIWQAMPRLRAADDPWPLIRTAGVRKAIDHLRARRPVESRGALDDVAADPAGDPAVDLDLAALPERESLCLRLYFFGGCSVREIARLMDAPPNTIKTWMHRGRLRLRAILERRGDLP